MPENDYAKNIAETLGRLDERTEAMETDIKEVKTDVKSLGGELGNLKTHCNATTTQQAKNGATLKTRVDWLQRLVWLGVISAGGLLVYFIREGMAR